MKVDSNTELETETPTHMIEPMNDSMFSVVPVIKQDDRHAADHARHRADRDQSQLERLEIAGQQDQDHHHREDQADRQRLEHLGHGRDLAADVDPHPAGRLAGIGDGLGDLTDARPRSSPSTLAVMLR